MEKCQLRLDNLTKPLASLGSFEHLARQIAGITANPRPRFIQKSIVIMAGDHGIAAGQGADYPTATVEMITNVCRGSAIVNVFAGHVSARTVVVDVGVAAELPPMNQLCSPKVAKGTQNITQGPAMSKQQAIQSIRAGVEAAREELQKGSKVLGLGSLGAGSRAAGAAIVACYQPDFLHKLNDPAVETALTVNCPDTHDPLDVLSKVGGLEIAGLVGVILGAAEGGAAVVLDDLSTSAAAVIAVQLAPHTRDYLIGSHFSVEPAHKAALDIIGVPAYLYLDMELGDGTGAALGISLIDAALHVLNDMKTFGEAQVAVAQDGPGALRQNKHILD